MCKILVVLKHRFDLHSLTLVFVQKLRVKVCMIQFRGFVNDVQSLQEVVLERRMNPVENLTQPIRVYENLVASDVGAHLAKLYDITLRKNDMSADLVHLELKPRVRREER